MPKFSFPGKASLSNLASLVYPYLLQKVIAAPISNNDFFFDTFIDDSTPKVATANIYYRSNSRVTVEPEILYKMRNARKSKDKQDQH